MKKAVDFGSNLTTKQKQSFRNKLLNWASTITRKLAWKENKDPYSIWLSEIILQQTRVEQGTPYYIKFISNFPTVTDLANAEEDRVMQLWEGLGYYSRARNLHSAAKHIAYNLEGNFPRTYEEILELKGVGPYTAAAISSFAYKLPYAVVDGNVYRVLSRVFGIETAIDSTEGKKQFAQLAQELITINEPDTYNQAIMDFGALQCTPKSPNCSICPFIDICVGKSFNRINNLPFKAKKLKKTNRFFHFLVIENEGQLLIEKRTAKDIWQNLYQFPLIESSSFLSADEITSCLILKNLENEWVKITFKNQSKPYKHVLSHQNIAAKFYHFSISSKSKINLAEESKAKYSKLLFASKSEFSNYAFPRLITRYLEELDSESQQLLLL